MQLTTYTYCLKSLSFNILRSRNEKFENPNQGWKCVGKAGDDLFNAGKMCWRQNWNSQPRRFALTATQWAWHDFYTMMSESEETEKAWQVQDFRKLVKLKRLGGFTWLTHNALQCFPNLLIGSDNWILWKSSQRGRMTRGKGALFLPPSPPRVAWARNAARRRDGRVVPQPTCFLACSSRV